MSDRDRRYFFRGYLKSFFILDFAPLAPIPLPSASPLKRETRGEQELEVPAPSNLPQKKGETICSLPKIGEG